MENTLEKVSTETSINKVKAIECRYAIYSKHSNEDKDIHLVKEQIHYDDGTIKPNVRIIEDYIRPFWITKKGLQKHNSKKEWEHIDNLIEFKCTQTKLRESVARALQKPWFNGPLRELCQSPYVYGVDVNATSLIKYDYKQKWKDAISPYTNAVFDTETDVVNGTKQIVMATVSFKNRLYTAVQKSFVNGYSDVINRVNKLAEEHIGDIIKERNIDIVIEIVDSEIDIVKNCIGKAHEWLPDFLSVWNIEFDMDKIIEACDRANVNIEDILSDPKVPKEYKHFKFTKGAAKKTTASGVVQVFKQAQRWHKVICPSGFHWIDAMQTYKHVRAGQKEEDSYALDAILTKHKIKNKLKFKEAEQYSGLKWHQFMQSNYPLEYIVYNMFDCISMEMLDEKTLDLQLSLPMFSGMSDFTNFNSQPKRAVTNIHFYCLENNRVIASTGPEMTEELDSKTLPLKDWIVMLQSHQIMDNGLCIVKENLNLRTNVRIHVGDLDVAASYPNGGIVFNISKETTVKELVEIVGINKFVTRMATINLSAGPVNAVEICNNIFNMPTHDQWLEAFNKELELSTQ